MLRVPDEHIVKKLFLIQTRGSACVYCAVSIMTMDIGNRKNELKAEVQIIKNEEQTEVAPVKVVKRPFDVAFLMLPDEKLKQKQVKIGKVLNYGRQISIENGTVHNTNESEDTDEEIEVGNNDDVQKCIRESSPKLFNGIKYYPSFPQKPQIFDDPNLSKVSELKTKGSLTTEGASDQKSAFTKVNLPKETRTSPNLSISPDLSYQNSLSPSPPILPRNYPNFSQNMLSPNHIFKSQNPAAYQANFSQESFAHNPLENHFLMKTTNPELLQPNFSKMRPVLSQYRPDVPYNYHQQFQTQDVLKIGQPELNIRNPAAAILTSLLPPSLAALSLPAQNVCAKCNISFRMTSDLVYHMRSHHKNDSVDFTRKRREEKLKCPVCAESFRERHHLTRHMTAHQDKDEDAVEPELKKKGFAAYTK